MLAGWYEKGGPADEVIRTGEMETPRPGPGEVLVRLHASGINPSDYKKRGNAAGKLEFPRIVPHSDGAGVVEQLGAGVTGFRPGDRVWTYSAQWKRPMGTAAEYIALPAALVRPLPDNTSFAEGACFGIPAMTGHRAVFSDGPVAGKTVYVPGATGRVGAYAVQFAKWGGARVIASSGSDAGVAVCRDLGADVALDRRAGDLAVQILAATNGRGVDRIIEVNFAGNLPVNEKILAEHGSICNFGSGSPTATIDIGGRRARNMSIRFIFVYLLDEAMARETCEGVERAAREGALRHRIAGRYPLTDLARAHREAEIQSGTGHVVVEM